MTTALAARPAPITERKAGLVRRVSGLRHTSPGRLQLLIAVLVGFGLLSGLLAGVAGASARAGTSDLGDRAQPLLVESEAIYAALADADTTAAQAFLAGGLEPSALTRRYDADLERATTALTSAARRTPEDGRAAEAVRNLSAGVAQYSALVATARANNRQGLPIGSSYLSEASRLNRDTLQPQARELFQGAQDEVEDGYSAAGALGWVALLMLSLLILLITLIVTQRYLSRRTQRTFNVPLLAATGLTLVFTIGAIGILAVQQARLDRAANQGSGPMASIAQSRLLTLQARGDEALTLAARAGSGPYEQDFTSVEARLNQRGGPMVNQYDELDPQLGRTMQRASSQFQKYAAIHKDVRALDDNGEYDKAVALAIGPQTTKVFEDLRGDLDSALENRKAFFTSEIDRAGSGLTLLAVLGPLLAVAICIFAFAGLRARLEEYR
ncbi:hypothetical protein Aab01nite_13080 [Paractinoplanes abujensis]|uniref:Secreted protein n=1 Tax=Paractinoplanes abujensis TaxID=882441 RepID=A0A7W7CLP9_9ACTN|nr:hypothetical protein [Actinoplanes abujensis]MBB4690869.1 hypothetical protein [Actinoplanes abujensis]GID17718.1 hypothetical protein Aab01nite_13080 [Actinoplanes abujensis]